jgi:hypothetical protein
MALEEAEEAVTKYLVWDLTTLSDGKVAAIDNPMFTIDPHSAYQKYVRAVWRSLEEKHPDVHWRDSSGLMYAVWSFSDGVEKLWAIEHGKTSEPDEVWVVTSKNTWNKVRLAVHPDSPIVFN